jgi:hypothetical protein
MNQGRECEVRKTQRILKLSMHHRPMQIQDLPEDYVPGKIVSGETNIISQVFRLCHVSHFLIDKDVGFTFSVVTNLTVRN